MSEYVSCFVAGRIPGRECYGAMTRHHIVPKQRLKRFYKSLGYRKGRPSFRVKALVEDERNLIDVCFGCHQLVEGGSVRVEPSDLPAGFYEFVADYQLEAELPRHLTIRDAA